jgi:hypothetical protein
MTRLFGPPRFKKSKLAQRRMHKAGTRASTRADATVLLNFWESVWAGSVVERLVGNDQDRFAWDIAGDHHCLATHQ